jgi:hypothetical protein
MALTRSMTAPTTGEPVSTAEPIMVVRLTGIAVRVTPMARGAARQPGTMGRVAPQDGVVAALHGTIDREISAVSEAALLRGVAARGAQGDGEAARSPGAAAPDLSTELTVAWGDGDGDGIICFTPDRNLNI